MALWALHMHCMAYIYHDGVILVDPNRTFHYVHSLCLHRSLLDGSCAFFIHSTLYSPGWERAPTADRHPHTGYEKNQAPFERDLYMKKHRNSIEITAP